LAAQAAPALPSASAVVAAEVPQPASLLDQLDKVERQIIERTLQSVGFDPLQAAEKLGLSRRQMQYRMRRLSISHSEQ
jgi:two-component system response regulator PilR (NtrC family)